VHPTQVATEDDLPFLQETLSDLYSWSYEEAGNFMDFLISHASRLGAQGILDSDLAGQLSRPNQLKE
jgi:hypothetical protein